MNSPPFESTVRSRLAESQPLEVYRDLIEENNALIREPRLDNGREIAEARALIHTVLVETWAREQQEERGYNKPFAVVALGGTGRLEMAPYSDTDFAFLFDDAIEGNAFLLKLQRQVLHTDKFRDRHGFDCEALPFGLDDVPAISEKQLNSFLDMRPVYDPHGLAAAFRERIRATYDPFEHFLHVQQHWKKEWEPAVAASESLEAFDIKNAGLRLFLGGIWTLGGNGFLHSHDVYRELQDSRDLDAYYFLLRIRAWVHSRLPARRRAPGAMGNHPEDIMRFREFTSFGDMLGADAGEERRFAFDNEVRARLLSARRRVAGFARAVIGRELRNGRLMAPDSRIVYRTGGLFCLEKPDPASTDVDKSRAALSLLLAAQRYEVGIDPSELRRTFRDAGDWLTRVPEVSALFYERRGSLALSFEFLSKIDGAEDRLFPGYGRFEASLDERVMTEKQSLRSKLERDKIRHLEEFVAEGERMLTDAVSEAKRTNIEHEAQHAVCAALLDADHLAAVKLALKTKRLPLTDADLAMRADESRPLHERFASGMSGIPLAEYYTQIGRECGFSEETVAVAEFLVANRRTFKRLSMEGLNDDRQAKEFADLCQDEQRLRALFVFTCADRFDWESEREDPARWFNLRELFSKSLERFRPPVDPTSSLLGAGYRKEELEILKDFGSDFFSGGYRRQANRFGAHLVRLAEDPEAGPKAAIVRDGTATMIGIATHDYRGLATSISGALWENNVLLRQAHLFSAARRHLALDFFHVAPGDAAISPELPGIIETAIRERRHIGEGEWEDGNLLPELEGRATIKEARPGHYRLSFETERDARGVVFALTSKIYRHLGANIYGLTAHAAHGTGKAYISVYHSLPPGISLENAQAIVDREF